MWSMLRSIPRFLVSDNDYDCDHVEHTLTAHATGTFTAASTYLVGEKAADVILTELNNGTQPALTDNLSLLFDEL